MFVKMINVLLNMLASFVQEVEEKTQRAFLPKAFTAQLKNVRNELDVEIYYFETRTDHRLLGINTSIDGDFKDIHFKSYERIGNEKYVLFDSFGPAWILENCMKIDMPAA